MSDKKETKLHEILAAEKSVTSKATLLLQETLTKLGKGHFFEGHLKTLTMIQEGPTKAAIEAAAREHKALPTTVQDTLNYTMASWANAENLLATKNLTNQSAKADIMIGATKLAEGVPIDELMGLENRLVELRKIFHAVPTLDASKVWKKGDLPFTYLAEPEIATKTDKTIDAKVLYPATDKHPAQVKEYSYDETVGQFTRVITSGATTTYAKAEALTRLDDLIVAVKQARTRANDIPATKLNVGSAIADYLMEPINNPPTF